jgi:co-chaperonin GroES (HSP10)
VIYDSDKVLEFIRHLHSDFAGSGNGMIVPGERIAVLRDPAEETMKYGKLELAVAAGHEDKPRRGTIVSIGDKVTAEFDNLKLGMRVLFNRYHNIEIQVLGPDGDEYELNIFHPLDIYAAWKYGKEKEDE